MGNEYLMRRKEFEKLLKKYQKSGKWKKPYKTMEAGEKVRKMKSCQVENKNKDEEQIADILIYRFENYPTG